MLSVPCDFLSLPTSLTSAGWLMFDVVIVPACTWLQSSFLGQLPNGQRGASVDWTGHLSLGRSLVVSWWQENPHNLVAPCNVVITGVELRASGWGTAQPIKRPPTHQLEFLITSLSSSTLCFSLPSPRSRERCIFRLPCTCKHKTTETLAPATTWGWVSMCLALESLIPAAEKGINKGGGFISKTVCLESTGDWQFIKKER